MSQHPFPSLQTGPIKEESESLPEAALLSSNCFRICAMSRVHLGPPGGGHAHLAGTSKSPPTATPCSLAALPLYFPERPGPGSVVLDGGSNVGQLPKRSSQPGHPQSSGTPQALGTTQFLTQASSFLALSLGTQPSPGILSPLSHLRQPPLWLQRPGPCLLLTSVPSTLVEQMSCSILT